MPGGDRQALRVRRWEGQGSGGDGPDGVATGELPLEGEAGPL